MELLKKSDFNVVTYLANSGSGRNVVHYKAKRAFFAQGDAATFVIYIHSGRAKLTVVSERGKEATVTLLGAGDFVGEESLGGAGAFRTATACAISACVVMKIDRAEMLRVLRQEHAFSDFFMKFMLVKGIRTQSDLIDQLFNSSEKRLARTLLLMADYGEPGKPEALIPKITQETLAEMIGTTRSRVSFFMNRFRKLGYISYNGRIHVHKSLLSVVLKDSLPTDNASRPKLLDPPRVQDVLPREPRSREGMRGIEKRQMV